MKLAPILRSQVLKGHGEAIRKILLTQALINLLTRIGTRRVTCPEIASELGVSLQNVNAKMERLTAGGYLRRINVGHPSGGPMFEYFRTGGPKP